MQKDTTYWRARLDAIQQLITEEKGGDRSEKNNYSVLLRNGIVPEGLKERYDEAFKTHLQAWIRVNNKQPLSFSEFTRFNNWFSIHPEKVAGKEVIKTSREFPISIKGNRQDIILTITKTLHGKKAKSFESESERIRIAEVKAQAKFKLLQLLKI